MKTAVVFGGYGVFGAQVVHELVTRGMTVVVAGRDPKRAEAVADAQNPPLDLITEDHVLVDCAGPFSERNTQLAEACALRGAHYVDIADDRKYCSRIRALADRYDRSAAVYGCSSLPGISLALFRVLTESSSTKAERVRTTLFIGNDNPKGRAAVRALVHQLGKSFQAPQGNLRSLAHKEVVDLPIFGRRSVYDFECADYDLVEARSLSVKVGFELRAVTAVFALMARLSSEWGPAAARVLERLGSPRIGSSGGVVQVEVFEEGGSVRRASLAAAQNGQRMAILPAVLTVMELARGRPVRGAITAPDFLGARKMLDAIGKSGPDGSFTIFEN